MRKTRVFVEFDPAAGETVDIGEEAAHYLDRVLRLREGDRLHVFNGTGGSYEAEILSRRKKSLTIRLLGYSGDDRESDLALTLAQGISKGPHMDFTVQKAAELGIRKIVPVFTAFSDVRMEAERARRRVDHWRGIAVSACEQCGRNRLPEIEVPLTLPDWLAADANPRKLVLHPGAREAMPVAGAGAGAMTILCGPEGGLSEEELAAAVSAGFRPVSLGPRTLRTETAAVAAIVQCQTLWGDMM